MTSISLVLTSVAWGPPHGGLRGGWGLGVGEGVVGAGGGVGGWGEGRGGDFLPAGVLLGQVFLAEASLSALLIKLPDRL